MAKDLLELPAALGKRLGAKDEVKVIRNLAPTDHLAGGGVQHFHQLLQGQLVVRVDLIVQDGNFHHRVQLFRGLDRKAADRFRLVVLGPDGEHAILGALIPVCQAWYGLYLGTDGDPAPTRGGELGGSRSAIKQRLK